MEGQRIVAEHDAHLVAVGLDDLLQGVLPALAERTLVVGERDDGNRRLGVPDLGTTAGRDLHRGRPQLDARLVLALQLLDERGPASLRLLVLQVLDDLRLHLLEGLALQLLFVLVVDLLDDRVVRGRHLGFDLFLLELRRGDLAGRRFALEQLLGDRLVEPFAHHLVALRLDLDQLRLHPRLDLGAREHLVADRRERLFRPDRRRQRRGHIIAARNTLPAVVNPLMPILLGDVPAWRERRGCWVVTSPAGRPGPDRV